MSRSNSPSSSGTDEDVYDMLVNIDSAKKKAERRSQRYDVGGSSEEDSPQAAAAAAKTGKHGNAASGSVQQGVKEVSKEETMRPSEVGVTADEESPLPGADDDEELHFSGATSANVTQNASPSSPGGLNISSNALDETPIKSSHVQAAPMGSSRPAAEDARSVVQRSGRPPVVHVAKKYTAAPETLPSKPSKKAPVPAAKFTPMAPLPQQEEKTAEEEMDVEAILPTTKAPESTASSTSNPEKTASTIHAEENSSINPSTRMSPSVTAVDPQVAATDDLIRRAQERVLRRDRISITSSRERYSTARALDDGQKGTEDAITRQRLTRENERLHDELAMLSKENQRLRLQSQTSYREEIETKNRDIESLLEKVRQVEQEKARSVALSELKREDAEQRANRLKEDAILSEQSVEQARASLRQKELLIASLQEQLEERDSVVKEAERSYEEAAKKWEKERAQFAEDLTRKDEHLQDSAKQRQQLTQLNAQFLSDRDAAVAQQKKLQEALQQLTAELRSEKEKHSQEILQQRRDTEELRYQLKERVAVQHSELTEERRLREHYQSRMEAFEDELHKALKNHEEEREATVTQHRRESEAWEKAVSKLREENLKLVSTNEELIAERDRRVASKVTDLQRELKDKEKAHRAELAVMSSKVAQLEEQLRGTRREIEVQKNEYLTAIETAKVWKREKETVEEKVTVLNHTLNELLQSDDTMALENASLKKELAVAQENASNAMASCYKLEAQLTELSTENDRLSVECTRLCTEREELLEENEAVLQELGKYRNELQMMMAKRTASVLSRNASPR